MPPKPLGSSMLFGTFLGLKSTSFYWLPNDGRKDIYIYHNLIIALSNRYFDHNQSSLNVILDNNNSKDQARGSPYLDQETYSVFLLFAPIFMNPLHQISILVFQQQFGFIK